MSRHAFLIAEAFNRPHLFEPTYAANVFQIATTKIGHHFEHNLPGDLYDGETGALITNHQSYMRSGGGGRDGARWYRLEGAEHIGVLPVVGSMVHRGGGMASMDRTYASIEADYDDMMSDKKIRAVVIEMDSPGGTVSGAFGALEFLRENKTKPVHVLTNERALSGGLLLGSFADSQTVLRTAVMGSLGAVVTHLNVEEKMAMQGIKATMIFSGAHKIDGNPYEEIPESVVAEIKSDLDSTRGMFAEAVNLGSANRTDVMTGSVARQVSVDELLSQEAQIYRGELAVAAGLATGVTTSPSQYYRAIANQYSSGAGSSVSAQPEQQTTDDDSDQGGDVSGQTTEPNMDPKLREQMKAELKAEMEQEARVEAQLAEDRKIEAERLSKERVDAISGHELAKLRPKLAKELIADESVTADQAINFMSKVQPEVTAPAAAATGSVIGDLENPDNQPGITSSTDVDTGGDSDPSADAYAQVLGYVEAEYGSDSSHLAEMTGYAAKAMQDDKIKGTAISDVESTLGEIA